ncbi:MAG: family 78 glycoside hydrolase catalytic domain [Bacteroidota bacterium]|nr:family 78 glycoside hydrolase catalytic domain [Bacteroidota bacterium]
MKNQFFLIFLIIATITACSPPEIKPEVSDLRCEYLSNPIGLDVPAPRLSWQMKKAVRGAQQTAYRIMVATTDDLLLSETPDLWDSGKIDSDQSIQLEYKGKPLKSGMKVSWKVKIWDEEKNESSWSTISNWEMGLLDKADWQAKWIGTPASIISGEHKLASPLFRKEVSISKKIKKARAYISGLGYYELYINGGKIGDHVLSPNQTNYDRRKVGQWGESRIGNMNTTVLYETFDITSVLKSGANVFGVILGNGWYIQADRPDDTMLWYDTPRLIAQIVLEYEDGTQELVSSDESWKSSLSPILYNGLHSGEIYDARLEQKGWNEGDFDDSKWMNAVTVRPPTGTLKAQVSPPDRVTKTIKPISVSKRGEGVYRFDMGRLFSGWARLKISGAKGTELKLRFIEEFGPTYGQTDTYILKGEGTEVWEPRFTWHAFRYVDVYGSPTGLTIENLDGRVVNTDIQRAGSFECSNSLLNKILDNYQWTQLGNVHGGIPSDCPHRERRGYTGDGQISAKAAILNFDMSQFYTKWLGDISDAQNQQTGYVPNTTPYQDGGGGTAWGSAAVIIPWYMYQYYGDARILQNHYSGMKHWIEYMKNSLNKDGILANQGLGEWVPPDIVDIPADFVNSCYYYHCCHLMSQISGVLANTADQAYFAGLAEKAKSAINKVYFDAANSNYSIGRQGSNVYPLGFGIAENQNVGAVFANLVKNITGPNKAHFDTGILGTPLLLEVLTEMDRPDLAYTLMNQRDFPGFGYMIEKGATTIWETFQGDVSHSHPMFGSVCAWFYQSLGGISPDPLSPGFKHALIKPIPVSSLSFANTSYQSMYGEIKTQWKFEGEDFLLNVSLPANTSATLSVLAVSDKKVTESGQSISGNRHVKFLKNDGKYVVYEIGSGDYQFLSVGSRNLLKNTILSNPIIHPTDTLAQVNDSVLVSITSDVAEAGIYYTTDRSEPDSTSIRYKNPFYVSNPTVIKAKAVLKGYESSFVKTNYIDFVDPEVNGLKYNYYEGKWMKLPDFQKFPVIKSGIVYEFGLDKIIATKDEYALAFEGKIEIKNDGVYEFFIKSNDGSRLLIADKMVIDHDGPHGADIEATGKISLSKGMHPIRLDYFQAGGGMYLSVQYSGPDIEKQVVPAAVLFQK